MAHPQRLSFSKCGFCKNSVVLRGAATALLLALLQGFSACFNLQAKRVLVAFCASRNFKLPGLKALFLAL